MDKGKHLCTMSKLVFASIATLIRTVEYKANEPWCDMPRGKHTSASSSPPSNETSLPKSLDPAQYLTMSATLWDINQRLHKSHKRILLARDWHGIGHGIRGSKG